MVKGNNLTGEIMSHHSTTAVYQPQSRSVSKTLFQIIGISFFILLTTLGAQLEIQRYPVPYTLQTWFVLMAGAFLGKRNGAVSMFFYLLLGIVGVPVFSQWGFGLAKILGPSGGYLLGFPIAAFVVGCMVEHRKSFFWLTVSMVTGMIIIYFLGTLHLYLVCFHNWSDSITQGLLIFSWWDGLKIVAAAGIVHQLRKHRAKSIE
jgi:biotin transport system substrate-specific component